MQIPRRGKSQNQTWTLGPLLGPRFISGVSGDCSWGRQSAFPVGEQAPYRRMTRGFVLGACRERVTARRWFNSDFYTSTRWSFMHQNRTVTQMPAAESASVTIADALFSSALREATDVIEIDLSRGRSRVRVAPHGLPTWIRHRKLSFMTEGFCSKFCFQVNSEAPKPNYSNQLPGSPGSKFGMG